jgi:hypothetical protein
MPRSTIRIKLTVRVPSYDVHSSLLPVGTYVFKTTRIHNNRISGTINDIIFTFGVRTILKMISNQQRVPVSPIRTRLPVTSSDVTSPLNDNSCPICLGTMAQHGRTRLRCNHEFHDSCITRWLGMSRNCPVCRRRSSVSTVRRISRPSPYRVVRHQRRRARNTSLPALRH